MRVICVAINIELEDENISDEQKQELLLVQSVHIGEAITQGGAMNAFVWEFVGKEAKDFAIKPGQKSLLSFSNYFYK